MNIEFKIRILAAILASASLIGVPAIAEAEEEPKRTTVVYINGVFNSWLDAQLGAKLIENEYLASSWEELGETVEFRNFYNKSDMTDLGSHSSDTGSKWTN